MEADMIAEQAAFNYALLKTDTALYPRGVFGRYVRLSDDGYGPHSVERLRAEIARCRAQAQGERGQARAFLELLADDATKATAFLERSSFDEFDATALVEEYTAVAEEYYLRRLSLAWSRVVPAIVQQFPPPFDSRDWFAFAATSDPFPVGIFYLHRHMMPGVVQLATLHENVHFAAMGPGGYYRYFDEGIANLLAYVVYYHHTGDLGGVSTFHTFLDEINVLYAYPPMVRIMASLVSQVGMRGLYALIRWRVTAPERVDWHRVLVACRAGRLDASMWPAHEDDRVPAAVDDLQTAADKVIGLICFPEQAPISPIAYQVLDALYSAGTMPLAEVRSRWNLSEAELTEVLAELRDPHAVWAVSDDQLVLFGHSELLSGAGILRASAGYGPAPP
jgi:hypothetical protein